MLEFQLWVPILYKFKLVGYSQEWHLFIYQYQSTLIRETWSLQHFGGGGNITHNSSVRSDCSDQLLPWKYFIYSPHLLAFRCHCVCDMWCSLQKTCLQKLKYITIRHVLPVCLFVCLLTCLFVCLYSHCIKPDCSCSVLYCDLLGIAIYCDI